MSAFIITRIQTHDYDSWRPMFDQDRPRAREKALLQRVLRSIDDPNEVFIYLEFASLSDAEEARERLASSGVLDRFETSTGRTCLSMLSDRRPGPCPLLVLLFDPVGKVEDRAWTPRPSIEADLVATGHASGAEHPEAARLRAKRRDSNPRPPA